MSLSSISSSLCSLPAGGGRWIFPVCGCVCVLRAGLGRSFTLSHSSLCVSLWSQAVQDLPDGYSLSLSISQECIKMLDSLLHLLHHKQTHKNILLILNRHRKLGGVYIKHLCIMVSILLGNFPQQTTTFTMINDVK